MTDCKSHLGIRVEVTCTDSTVIAGVIEEIKCPMVHLRHDNGVLEKVKCDRIRNIEDVPFSPDTFFDDLMGGKK